MMSAERFHRRVTCRLLGHKFTVQKMSGLLCRRCRTFTHNPVCDGEEA
jgi:hypothetical protein